MGGKMSKLDPGHEFVESHSGVLSDEKIFSEIGLRMFLLKKLDEIVKEFFVHLFSDNNSFFPVFIELT